MAKIELTPEQAEDVRRWRKDAEESKTALRNLKEIGVDTVELERELAAAERLQEGLLKYFTPGGV